MAKRDKRPEKGQPTSWRHTIPAYLKAISAGRKRAETARKNAAIKKVSNRAIFERPVAFPPKKEK